MSQIKERGSTHVYKVNKISKEEMDGLVNLCVYEQPAYCNAACPLKLDTKAMLKAVSECDYKKALTIYEKAALFPHIVSQACTAPCEQKCRMRDLGDGIAIRDIEAAIAKFGEKGRSSGIFRMKKRKRAAVFGSGLFPLFLAAELEKKAYPVTVFCPEPDLSSFLMQGAAFLDAESFSAELTRLKEKDISFVFSCSMDRAFFEEKSSEFDIICAAEEFLALIYPAFQYDKALMYWREEKMICGSSENVIDAAFGAKKAALTADRIAQNLDPANTRGEEGPTDTRLYTNPQDARILQKLIPANGVYTKDEAAAEAQRCMQCHCEECMKSCAYLKHYKKHPGLLAREIFNNTQIIMGDHPLNKAMNACSLCGQCTVVCPNGFDMAAVCKSARENMVSTDKMPLSPHEFALMDMLYSNSDAFLCRPQPGYSTCRYVFFPGCQAAAIAPGTVYAAYEDLCARLDGGVALILGCCGIIADWAGRYELYQQTVRFLDNELAKLGDPQVIVGCPSCKKALGKHPRPIETKGIWEVLNEIGLPQIERPSGEIMALHDSCGARGEPEIQASIRLLAQKLGCSLVETPDSGDRSPCCGYGGLTSYTNQEVAHEMADKCLVRSREPYLSYCMACRDRFAREGRASRHILELVYGTDAGSPPDISEKRYNRLRLKQNLLRDVWNEEVRTVPLDYELTYTPDALQMMDARMILKSDVEAVIHAMRESGQAIEDSESGYLMACHRSGNVTFWVALTETDAGYVVHRAYSHRMNVVKRN